MSVVDTAGSEQALLVMLKDLRLPGMRTSLHETLSQANTSGWSHQRFLRELLEAEIAQQNQSRIARHLKQAKLPSGKTRHVLDDSHFPEDMKRKLAALWDGGFIKSHTNVLMFGPPGVGKTHIASAIGRSLIERGIKVCFTTAAMLVQHLLLSKQNLQLDKALGKLDRFDCLIIDDIGYVSQSKEEMEVLFTLLARRYERRSVIITSNLVFSQWDQIFGDPMTTAAAIDRLVHHSVIIEINTESYRKNQALKKLNKGDPVGDF